MEHANSSSSATNQKQQQKENKEEDEKTNTWRLIESSEKQTFVSVFKILIKITIKSLYFKKTKKTKKNTIL